MRVLPLFLISILFSFHSLVASAAVDSIALNHTEVFVSGSIVVKGMGLPPGDATLLDSQKKALSLRAAYVMALRAAVEAVDGVLVSGTTTVKDASILSEKVKVSISSFVRGAEVVSEQYDEESGIATVNISVPLTGIAGLATTLQPNVGSGNLNEPFFRPQRSLKAGNNGYDGLILDVRGLGFKPAIVNRVLTKESEVVFAPSMITNIPMEKSGSIGYTDNPRQASEMLSELGSRQIVTIRPSGLSGSTDVILTKSDALLVYGSDKKSGFLKRGRIVFVLGPR